MRMQPRKWKKFAAVVLCAAVLGTGNTFAMPDDLDYVLFYENTFDNKWNSLIDETSEYGAMTINKAGMNSAEYNGNPAVCMAADQGPGIKFTYKFAEAIESGVMIYSFDISKLDRVLTGQYDKSYVSLNGSQGNYVLYIPKDKVVGPKDNLANWNGDESITVPFENDKIYRIQQVFDMNNRKAHTYVDGELLSTKNISATQKINSLEIWLDKVTAYFDNYTIEYYREMPMEVQEYTIQAGSGSIVLHMTDGIDQKALPPDGYAVTDLFSGVTAAAERTVTGTRSLTLTSDMVLEEGGAYLVTLPALQGMTGSVVTRRQIETAVGSGAYLTGLRLIDCFGNSRYLSEENPAEVKRFALQFGAAANGMAAVQSMILTDAAGNITTFSASSNPENPCEIFIDLDQYLVGEQRYTLSLNDGLDRTYEIPIVTAKGTVTVQNCSFYDSNGMPLESLADLPDGARVTMVLSLVKTVTEQRSVVASYSMWEGLDMTGFNFQKIQMDQQDSETEARFEIVIENPQNTVLKGFLWKGLGEINPLNDVFVISSR